MLKKWKSSCSPVYNFIRGMYTIFPPCSAVIIFAPMLPFHNCITFNRVSLHNPLFMLKFRDHVTSVPLFILVCNSTKQLKNNLMRNRDELHGADVSKGNIGKLFKTIL